MNDGGCGASVTPRVLRLPHGEGLPLPTYHSEHAAGLDVVAERLLAAGLAKFKLPEQLVVLDSLPMTASGKVQKHEIVRALAGDAP